MGMGLEDSRFHVLAVDDSLLDRKLIERLLKTSSFQVTAVDSGTKALEFLGLNNVNDGDIDDDDYEEGLMDSKPASVVSDDEIEISLIITDYCMPGMTGYDLLKKIKESASLRNIPVVIMSSENVPSRINRCLEEGAEEFLLKPVQLADMDKLKPHIMKQKPKGEAQNNVSVKRKSAEEIHSPDKSRLRCQCDATLDVVASL